MADYTISGNIRDVTPDGTPDGLIGWVSPAQDVVQDSGSNSVHVAAKQLEFDGDGAFSVDVVSGIYTISVQFTGPSLAKEQRQTEPFEVVADVEIGSVTWRQVEVVTAEFAEQMYEVRDAVLAVPTTTDGLIAGRIADTASATYAGLAETFDPKLDLYVEDFAASGFTWGTDDTAPWQAALDAANAAGTPTRVIAKPGRVYRVNPLKLFSHTHIDLNGATLQPRQRVGGSNIWDALIYTAGCDPANGCTGDGATVVSDCTVTNGTLDTIGRCYAGVLAQRADNIRVLNCTLPTVQDKQGVRFDSDTTDCVADGNRITMILDSPFGTIVNAQGISCTSKTVDPTGGAYGLYGTGTVDTATFTQPTNLSHGHRISNNHIHNGTHAIALWGAADCVIQGNVITNPSHRGVILSPVSHRNVIDGNSCTGTFSCAFLLAFGSRFNVVSNNLAYCTDSQSELNAFRASFGASDNHFVGNYAYGVAGAAFRAMIGAINNSFVSNKAEACGVGIEVRSLNPDSGYQQNINTPALTGTNISSNDFIGCGVGIQLRAGTTTTTATTTPATTAGISVPIQQCAIIGNRVLNSTGNGALLVEDTAGSITAVTVLSNVMSGNGSTDWQTPRTSGHFTAFESNTGVGVQRVHRLPATGNSDEWRDSGDALRAFIGNAGAIVTSNRFTAGDTVTSSQAIAYVNSAGNANIGLRVNGQASQTADIQQWANGLGPSGTGIVPARISAQGYFVTSKHAAPADADLAAGDCTHWFDQTNGAAKFMVKAKSANGTVVQASIPLAP